MKHGTLRLRITVLCACLLVAWFPSRALAVGYDTVTVINSAPNDAFIIVRRMDTQQSWFSGRINAGVSAPITIGNEANVYWELVLSEWVGLPGIGNNVVHDVVLNPELNPPPPPAPPPAQNPPPFIQLELTAIEAEVNFSLAVTNNTSDGFEFTLYTDCSNTSSVQYNVSAGESIAVAIGALPSMPECWQLDYRRFSVLAGAFQPTVTATSSTLTSASHFWEVGGQFQPSGHFAIVFDDGTDDSDDTFDGENPFNFDSDGDGEPDTLFDPSQLSTNNLSQSEMADLLNELGQLINHGQTNGNNLQYAGNKLTEKLLDQLKGTNNVSDQGVVEAINAFKMVNTNKLGGIIDILSTNGNNGSGGEGITNSSLWTRWTSLFSMDAFDTNAVHNMSTNLAAQKSAGVTGAIGNLTNLLSNGLGSQSPGSGSIFQINVAGETLDLDPAADPVIGSIVPWIRQLIAWVVGLGMLIWIADSTKDDIKSMGAVNEGQITIPGAGTLTQLAVAGFIVLAITPIALTGAGWFTVAYGDLVDNPFENMLGTALSGGAYLLNTFLPMSVIFAALLTRLVFPWVSAAAIFVSTATIKFLHNPT